MKLDSLAQLNRAISRHDKVAAIAIICQLIETENKPQWRECLARLACVIDDDMALFSVIAIKGNSKLPFAAFSSLPGADFCPGAGECINWCYSPKAWRYPAAYCRQAQNAWLLGSDTGRQAILANVDAINAKGKFTAENPLDFRLYVDGDFSSVEIVDFWFDALNERQWLAAYGYSKSFNEILASTIQAPDNYLLNLSGGHNHTLAKVETMRGLKITRGEFIAVNVAGKVTSSMHGERAHQAKLRQAHGSKAFTCPGKCGTCTPAGHACGSKKFAGIDIIIAVH
jgi:hypothetical protein